MIQTSFRLFIFLLFISTFVQAEQITEDLRLDGYLNIEMNNNSNPRGDNFKPSMGLQGRYEISDNLAITGQVHFKEGKDTNFKNSNSLEDYEHELKWLYLDYYLQDDLIFRAGAFQFPIFKSSETGDIGYTYTWTHTPLYFYGVFGADDFDGVELLKNFSYEDYNFTAQLSYGKSTNDLSDGRGTTRSGDVENLVGLTLKTSHENFILNVGYIQAKAGLQIPTILRRIVDSEVKFNMFALESEIYFGDYSLKSGFIQTHLSNVFPEDRKYYTSLEYNYKDFTPYILYAKEIQNFNNARGVTPPIPIKLINKQYQEKYSIGVRYDLNSNIALKLSYTHMLSTKKYISSPEEKIENNVLMGTINVVF